MSGIALLLAVAASTAIAAGGPWISVTLTYFWRDWQLCLGRELVVK